MVPANRRFGVDRVELRARWIAKYRAIAIIDAPSARSVRVVLFVRERGVHPFVCGPYGARTLLFFVAMALRQRRACVFMILGDA